MLKSARANHKERKSLRREETASQRLNCLADAHLVSNENPTVFLKAELQGLPLEGVEPIPERMALEVISRAFVGDFIGVRVGSEWIGNAFDKVRYFLKFCIHE